MRTRNAPSPRPAAAAIPSRAATRLAHLGMVLAASLALAPAGPALSNPLTEVPGARPAPSEVPRARPAPVEEPPPRDEAAERAEAEAANPSATAIIRSLAPFADGNPGAPPAPVAVAPNDGGPSVRIDPTRAIDLTVFFAYDSARLTPEARIQLQPLGEALGAPDLAGHGFLIAGHTDAAGGLAYNRRLSLARARAVKAHLVETYGIDPERLRVHGWGLSHLKAPEAPLSRVNRRVEVTLIAPRARSGDLRFMPSGSERSCAVLAAHDPRLLVVLDLDDFGAAPTPPPCAD